MAGMYGMIAGKPAKTSVIPMKFANRLLNAGLTAIAALAASVAAASAITDRLKNAVMQTCANRATRVVTVGNLVHSAWNSTTTKEFAAVRVQTTTIARATMTACPWKA